MDQERYKELISEGRANVINGLLAYGLAFELVAEDEINEELVSDMDYAFQTIEALVPTMKTLYELEQRRTQSGESFVDWLSRNLDKMK
jgi:hypothetical protein